jgi:GTP pyrophosphokinase
MVSLSASSSETQLIEGLSPADSARLLDALHYVTPFFENHFIFTEQNALQFAIGVASTLAMLKTDVDTRIAGLLFELSEVNPLAAEKIEGKFGKEIAELISGVRRLMRLREATLTQHDVGRGKDEAERTASQMEVLRKMVLAMANDMRVVLVRLASRVTTLRYFAECKRDDGAVQQFASETMDLYAPLANRLGVWQLKWELEDLSFRFLEPEQYKRIAKMLEENRAREFCSLCNRSPRK